jgi:hypothetical protein
MRLDDAAAMLGGAQAEEHYGEEHIDADLAGKRMKMGSSEFPPTAVRHRHWAAKD